jgi:DNA-damage-inducible protein J
MTRTSTIFARVEPEIKEQAEQVLKQLGIPMSNAISLFLRQVVLQRGIPFDIKLSKNTPLTFGSLNEKTFNDEIEKGLADLTAGRMTSADRVAEKMRQDYGK